MNFVFFFLSKFDKYNEFMLAFKSFIQNVYFVNDVSWKIVIVVN